MFKILRYFSIASFISIALAAALLGLFYREVAITGIVHLGEQSNKALAQTALNSVRPELVEYLAAVANIEKESTPVRPFGAELDHAIQGIMNGTTVVRIKIYNQHGIVVFSTKTAQIGRDQHDNPGFLSALGGQVSSKLIYHDTLNPFDQVTEDDNLIQTYLPVRRTSTEPIQGVFEIYTDVNNLVAQAERTQIAIIVGCGVILVLLYAALFFIVRRAASIIETQQHTIHERTKTLELLSAQLLTGQENERKRIAGDLHESVAQTLSAIKLQVEDLCHLAGRRSADENTKALEAVVAIIQSAIQEVRTMAMDLRPPSLDDLGVVATINWHCRQFQSLHPEIRVELEIEIEESEVSPALKIIIYRIIQETLDVLVKHALANLARIRLDRTDNCIALTIEDNGRMYKSGEASTQNDAGKKIWLAAIGNRAVLSGGTYSIETNAMDGTRFRLTWPV
jgi:signal transduction histidine kinase